MKTKKSMVTHSDKFNNPSLLKIATALETRNYYWLIGLVWNTLQPIIYPAMCQRLLPKLESLNLLKREMSKSSVVVALDDDKKLSWYVTLLIDLILHMSKNCILLFVIDFKTLSRCSEPKVETNREEVSEFFNYFCFDVLRTGQCHCDGQCQREVDVSYYVIFIEKFYCVLCIEEMSNLH